MDDFDDMPSQLEMLRMLQELTRKYNNLEKTVKQLQSQQEVKKVKLSNVAWLDKHCNPVNTMPEYINQIDADCSLLLDYTLTETCTIIISRNFENDGAFGTLPCYSINGTHYVYTNKWSVLSIGEFNDYIKVIEKSLMQKVNIWRKTVNIETFTPILMKLLQVNDGMYTHLRKHLTSCVSINLND